MNDLKFADCRDCIFASGGFKCDECDSGENFEEFMPDLVDMMGEDDGEED